MKSIAIFNNKGGVGKSTLSLLIADFFSSKHVSIGTRSLRVLVVDLDTQASSSAALVGPRRVMNVQKAEQSLADLVARLLAGRKVSLEDYLVTRYAGNTASKMIPLGELKVMVNDSVSTLRVEEKYGERCLEAMEARLRPMLEKEFDITIYDLPANIDRRNALSMAALGTVDFIWVPTEPSKITINAMAKTFEIIREVQKAARERRARPPKVVGIVLNKTDRRMHQYRLHQEDIETIARAHKTHVFENLLPAAPGLIAASDDSLQFETLRERYDVNYEHVRKVARELAEQCGFLASNRNVTPQAMPT